MEDKVQKLYNGLISSGFTEEQLGTFDTFNSNIQDPDKNRKFYDAMLSSGKITEEQLGTYDTFSANTLKKKDFPTASEESLEQESTSTSQQNLLKSERTPYFTVENIDEGVDSRLKSETDRYAQTLKESPKPVRSQMTWKAQERSKVREYNSTLADISESIQQNDVQHYLNVVKSPMLKSLTEKTTEIEEERMSNAVKNKIRRATKLRNELKTSNIVDSDELTWIDNNPLNIIDEYLPDSDLGEGVVGDALRTGKKAYKRWTQFGTSAVNNSLWGLGFLAMGETGKDLLALGQDIQANYDPSKLEEYASIGMGFAFDTPIFMALGGVGGVGAKAFTRVALRTTTKELMQLGLTREVAQGIALKSMSGAGQLALKGTGGAISGSGVLGTYDAINDAISQYKEAYANGEDLEHYDWRRTLEAWGEGVLIGTATGFISPMFSSAGEIMSSGLKRQAIKKAVTGGVGGLDFATESTLFAAIPAALDDRAITQDDIVESGLMLLAIKGGNLPLNMVGRINVSKTKGKPIEYTDRERELLGVTTDPYESIRNMSVEDLKKIEANRDISTLTKLKIMENHSGIAPRGEISIDAIRVEQEGDRVFLRTYRKEKEGSKYEYELLSENEYSDKTLADAEAKKGLEMLYDLEIRKTMQDLPVRQQGLAANRIVEVLGADSKKLKDVLDIPVFARNEEQRAIAQKFYEVAHEITGLGKNAYESKMLDDSFGTEKLHLKEREISPKKEEVVSKVTQEEKVAEIPTTEAKKEGIETEIKPEIDAKETGEKVEIPSQEEGLKGEEGGQVRVRESAENRLETETGKIDETKEEGLQGRSLAYEVGDIEAELSYDFTKETKKEVKAKYDKAKGRLGEVIDKNRSVLDEIDPKYTKHIVEQVNRLRPENATRVIKNVQKILENAQLREKVKGAFESKKKLDDLRNKPEWTQFIKGLDMKTRMGKKGKELSVRLNKIPVEKLPDTIIDDYIDVVNNLSSDKPDLGKVENFMNTYEAEIRKQEDLANIVVRDDKKAIERITMDAERLRTAMMVADATPEDIMTLKRQLGSLVGQAEKMRRMGVYERNEKGIKVWEDKLAELQTFIEELPSLTEEAQVKVKELEKQYKTQTIDEVSSRWNTLKESFVEEGKNTFTEGYEGRRVNEVMATLEKIKNDDWALERLSLSDVDDMVTNLDFIEYNKENPVANLTFHEKADRILGIYKASKAKGSIFDVVNANKESRRINEMLRMPVEKLAKKIGMRPDIHIGSLFQLTSRVKGDVKFKYIPEFIQNQMNLAGSMINNPIYNDITHPASEAINSAEKLTKDFLEPLYKELGLQRQSIFERYVFDFGKNRKDVKVFDRIKILESQLRAFEIMNDAQGRVIQSGEKFYGVELDGTPYKESGKVKMFDTAQEAIDYVKSKPIDRVGDRPLDFFALLNYDKDGNYSKERNNAVIAKGEKMNELEKMYFEEAYKDILERAKKNNPDITDLSQIRTEEDALSLLDANEMKLWGLFRDAYKKSEGIMSVVAASEGLALKTSNLYTPMNSRSMADMSYDKMTILDDLMSQAREGKRLEVTGNIYAKTKALKYIDFNGLRSFEKYVRDMSMSYYVIPEMRKQEIALKELAKEYKDSDISNLAKALKENILQGYQAEYSKRSMWGNMKLVQGKTVYDISKALKFTSQAVRNKLLNKSIRIAMDVTPNTIKMADKGFAKIDNKSEWKTFYSYNTGVMGAIDNLRYGQNKIGEYAVVENKGVAQTAADSWVSMGDNFSKSRWPAAFENAFQKLSGEKFDVKQYAYDWKYRDRINAMDSFSQAKSIADGYLEENLVPENKFSNRKYVNLLGYKMSTSNRMYDFLNQMSSYSAQENMGLMAYYNDIMYGSDEAAKVAYMKVGQMLAANMTYNIMSQLAYNGTMYLSGATFDSDEAKRISSENFREMWSGQNLLANLTLSASNLMLGGYMNMGRAMLSLGYNGLKSASKLGADKKKVYETNLAYKEWEKVYGTSRLIDPTLDFTKRSIPWESVVNVALPVTGSQFLQIASDVGTLGKQGKALVSTGEKYETEEFKMSEVIRATNAVLGAYINPFASDVNIMAKALNDEMYKSQLPVELFEADKIIHNFFLTYDEVNEIFDQTYNDVLARAKKDKIDNPEEEARRIANKKVQTYLEDVDNDNYYYLYTNGRNREYIDGLYELMKEVTQDKTVPNERKKELNKKFAEEAKRLDKLFEDYKKNGENTIYMFEDQDVSNEYFDRKIDEKVQNKLNLIEKKLIRYR